MKTAQLKSLVVLADGTMELNFDKLSSDGDSLGVHTQVFAADEPIIPKVEGFQEPALPAFVQEHADIARTPENVQAAKERKAAALEAPALGL